MDVESYQTPLTSRYASKEMSHNWSARKKHRSWRSLWIALAKAEKSLGLSITDEQITEMITAADEIDFAAAERKERELRHDVMSHIHVFGDQCPKAKPIIHLGATSCFVTDNTELIQLRDGLCILRRKLLSALQQLRRVCERHKGMPTLGFTHYQPAQLTTVGKRFSLYAYDLLIDLRRIDREIDDLPFLGVKGTTGTQASFLALFGADHEKVRKLDRMIAAEMGFDKVVPVSGQTYTRKIDFNVLSTLSAIAQSAHKMCVDMRLLANLREIEEPFESSQVGSSAMAYKRNPMRCERVCSLARFVMSLPANCAATHANQWFERTLDDSANRRIVLPEAFLAVDVILSLVCNIVGGLKVWEKVIAAHVANELPFMATENILMAAVAAGGDRQDLHEAIRKHSMEAARRVKEGAPDNDLLSRIKADPVFAGIVGEIDEIVNPVAFVGRAPGQVDEFVEMELAPALKAHASLLDRGEGESVTV